MKKILFVCTGNICRSPSAEAVLRHVLTAYKLQDFYEIDSAGTHGYHVGDRPDPRAIQAAKSRGISMKGIVARKVTEKDFLDFDEIVALDEGHYKILESLRPLNAKADLTLFMDYIEDNPIMDVPDPYYDGASAFEDVLDLLEQGVKEMLRKSQ